MARKRGRPKKTGKRTKSGRLSRAYQHVEIRDLGPDEARIKRSYLINGADPQLAATASGILLANGMITEEQHVAAMRYAHAHALVYGKVWRLTSPLAWDLPQHGEPPEKAIIGAKERIETWNAKITPEQRVQVANLSVFGFFPMELYVRRLGLRRMPEDERNWRDLLSGLDALAA
jgi:hypothetical protein